MTNNSKSNQNNQKNFDEIQAEAQQNLSKNEKDITSEIFELGYVSVTVEEFVGLEPDASKGQLACSQFIALKERCKEFLCQKDKFQNVVCIAQSKLPENIDAVENILINNKACPIYQRSGKLVRIVNVANIPQSKKNAVFRSRNSSVIKEVDTAFLTIFLTRIGDFIRWDARSKSFNKIDCPERISKYFIAEGEWKVPVLIGLINAPTLRINGSILDVPGYDNESGMFFVPGNCEFEKIPERPTKEDAEKAKESLLHPLKEFPFEDEASRSVVLAAILTSLIRKSIATAPLFGFTAPKMACGKSLLASIVATIATGKQNSVMAQSKNDDEEKKRLLAVLTEGDPIICYDNIEKPFGSTALCAILTQPEYKDRILGSSETRTVSTYTTFLATGNNLTFVGDISTRTLLCRLDPIVEYPEERLFDLDPLAYCLKNRGKLVRDGLVILLAYMNAGMPKQDIKQFGRFEAWSNWVRSSVVWIGMEDPCKSRKAIENTDPVRLALGRLLSCWHTFFGDKQVKARDVICASENHDNDKNGEELKEAIIELIPSNRGTISAQSLGKVLLKYKKRIENGFRLEQMEKLQGTTLWRVQRVN